MASVGWTEGLGSQGNCQTNSEWYIISVKFCRFNFPLPKWQTLIAQSARDLLTTIIPRAWSLELLLQRLAPEPERGLEVDLALSPAH
jgi:hypothetical protein